MNVYAFVGKSGTGKSYQAMGLARKLNVNYIIDDGILIHNQRKVVGSSAKREKTKVAAVKRAIFFYEDARKEMVDTLQSVGVDKLMIIGTSEKMVYQIAGNLEIVIDEIVYIEDISTPAEIETAKFHRMHYGKHVIPLPTLEVKKDFSGYLLDPLKIFSRVFGRKDKIIEKSVVRPTFSYIGQFTISNKTLTQIIQMAVINVDGVAKYTRIKLLKKDDCYYLELDINVRYGHHINNVANTALDQVKHYFELMTQMQVGDITITVKALE